MTELDTLFGVGAEAKTEVEALICVGCEKEITQEERHKVIRKWIICKVCVADARQAGQKIHILPSTASEVTNTKDLISWIMHRTGADFTNFKANAIILQYCGSSIRELAELADWCGNNSKHPEEPWQILFYMKEYLSSRKVVIQEFDPVQQRLDALWQRTTDPALRRQILSVGGKTDKRDALQLLRAHNG